MSKRNRIVGMLILMLGLTGTVRAVEKAPIRAERLQDPVTVDGRLEESSWQRQGYCEFWQREPDEGKPASERSEVWLAYDDDALYVAARLSDSQPELVSGLLGRRDTELDCDWFTVYLDPYLDKLSGFAFGITPAGSVSDRALYNDVGWNSLWDGIWNGKAQRDRQGWTVEMRIPFNQLRFSKKDGEYRWGVHFRRIVMRKNEVSDSAPIPRTGNNMVSLFKEMVGIEGIAPRPLIMVSPYLVGKGEFLAGEVDQATGNLGLDAKIGLRSNLTLDLCVNPDFGQVEVDPASINLSAAETYYQERRPFFIEGADLFTNFSFCGGNHPSAGWNNPRFFYSRRIGRPPQGSVSQSGQIDMPEWATILSAAKLTGTLGNGWKIGAIYGLTEREFAAVDDLGQEFEVEVEPLTHYAVLRTQKEFNQGRQGLGFLGTLVARDFADDSLRGALNSDSWMVGFDGWAFFGPQKNWVLSGWFSSSRVNGSAQRITSLQQEFPHYYQRPDMSHVNLDTGLTHLDGWVGRIEVNKEKGNLRFNAGLGAVSPGYDIRDGGYHTSADVINGHVLVGWQDFTVGKVIRKWNIDLWHQRNYNFAGDKIGEQRVIVAANAQFLNYWSCNFMTSYNPGHFSQTATRGGPLMKIPSYQWYNFTISSDSRKRLVGSLSGYVNQSSNGSSENTFSLSLSLKPSSRFSLSISPAYSSINERAQYVTQVNDPTMTATYGKRYVFSALDLKELSCSMRINWIFTPQLSLQGYIQPFLSVGHYRDFAELAEPSSDRFRPFGHDGSTIEAENGSFGVDPDGSGPAAPFRFNNPDFNLKSLRGTLVLRWEYLPGSSLYFVWTQNRADYANPGDFRFGRDLGDLFSARGDNVFMVKLTHGFNL